MEKEKEVEEEEEGDNGGGGRTEGVSSGSIVLPALKSGCIEGKDAISVDVLLLLLHLLVVAAAAAFMHVLSNAPTSPSTSRHDDLDSLPPLILPTHPTPTPPGVVTKAPFTPLSLPPNKAAATTVARTSELALYWHALRRLLGLFWLGRVLLLLLERRGKLLLVPRSEPVDEGGEKQEVEEKQERLSAPSLFPAHILTFSLSSCLWW